MISKDKVIEIFCIADDFCREFEKEVVKKALSDKGNTQKRRRKRMMSDAEVITILICFHFICGKIYFHKPFRIIVLLKSCLVVLLQ